MKYAGVKNGEVTFEVGKICLKFAEPKQSALMRTELVDFAWMSMKIPAHASPVQGDVRSRCFPAMGSANPKFIWSLKNEKRHGETRGGAGGALHRDGGSEAGDPHPRVLLLQCECGGGKPTSPSIPRMGSSSTASTSPLP